MKYLIFGISVLVFSVPLISFAATYTYTYDGAPYSYIGSGSTPLTGVYDFSCADTVTNMTQSPGGATQILSVQSLGSGYYSVDLTTGYPTYTSGTNIYLQDGGSGTSCGNSPDTLVLTAAVTSSSSTSGLMTNENFEFFWFILVLIGLMASSAYVAFKFIYSV